jgi:hypothetical protein
MDALRVASNNNLIASIQQDLQIDQSMPAQLSASKPPTAFIRRFKAHNKTTKRGMTGAEAAEKKRCAEEAAEIKIKKVKEAAEARKTAKACKISETCETEDVIKKTAEIAEVSKIVLQVITELIRNEQAQISTICETFYNTPPISAAPIKRCRANTRGINYKKLAGIRTNVRCPKRETEKGVVRVKE